MMTERQLDPHKVAFVICVNDEAMFRQALGYIQQLDTGGGISMEVIAIGDAVSMCEGYERARLQSDAKYKIYMHQDVLILRKDIVSLLVRQFRRNPKVGLIGLAGCKRLPPTGVWWNGTGLCNNIATVDWRQNPPQVVAQNFKAPAATVEAVDGLLMATQYDVPWRTDVFRGWHFYDVSQCLEYRRRGYKVVVPRQDGPWVLHQSKSQGTVLPADYMDQITTLMREYAKELRINDGIGGNNNHGQVRAARD